MLGIDLDLVHTDSGDYDLVLADNGDLASSLALDTPIIVSLFSDRRADKDFIPVPEKRRGWIGDEVSPGFQLGSLLWTFEQSRLTQSTLNSLADAARDSLDWMLRDSSPGTGTTIADQVLTSAVISDIGSVKLEITLIRPESRTEKRFFDAWENTGKLLKGAK